MYDQRKIYFLLLRLYINCVQETVGHLSGRRASGGVRGATDGVDGTTLGEKQLIE